MSRLTRVKEPGMIAENDTEKRTRNSGGSMRYWIVIQVCKLMGHPEREVRYPEGRTRVNCPCGRVDFFKTTQAGEPRIASDPEAS